MMARLSPRLVLFTGVLASSAASIFIRFAQEEAPSLTIAAYRLGIAALILTPFALKQSYYAIRNAPGNTLALALGSGLFLSVHFGTWVTSLEFTSVASSVALVQTTPLFVALLSPWVLKEPIRRNMTLGMILAVLGSIVIAISDACVWRARLECPALTDFFSTSALKGDLLALIGALGAAGYLLIGRKIRRDIDVLPYIYIVYSAAAVFLFLSAWASRTALIGFDLSIFIWFLLLALLPQLVAHTSYNWALRYLSASFVSIALLGEPVASTLWASWILGEAPPALRLIGAAFILVGLFIAASTQTPGSGEHPPGGNSG